MKLSLFAILLFLVCGIMLAEPIVEEGASDEMDASMYGDIIEKIDEIEFERHPRNMKRFTNKWQQIGPIWG